MGGAGNDRFVVHLSGNSSPTAPDTILDFEGGGVAGGDWLQLVDFAPMPLVLNEAPYEFTIDLSGEGGVQFPFAGDGLRDVVWFHDAETSETRLAVDVDDDGYFGEQDVYLVLANGPATLTAEDFIDTFSVFRLDDEPNTRTFTDASETIYALGGNDVIDAAGGDDVVFGGAGNDMTGGDGNNALYGGAGNDTLTGGDGYDALYGGEDNDTLTGDAGGDELRGGAGDDTLDGGDDGDFLMGEAGTDVLRGGFGNDTLWGGGDNDTLQGGADADQLDGGEGDDRLEGGDGDDVLYAGGGNDTLLGGQGLDTLYAADGAGVEILTGGSEEDLFSFGAYYSSSSLTVTDVITDFESGGSPGGDALYLHAIAGQLLAFDGLRSFGAVEGAVLGSQAGDGFVDVSYSHDGADTLVVADLNDDGLLGGDDLLIRLTGHVALTEEDFVGTFSVFKLDDEPNTRTFTDASETIYALGGNDVIDAAGGDDVVVGGAGNDTLTGGDGNNALYGGAGNDTLTGGDGYDALYGGEDNDTLTGDAGGDELRGGAGDDTLDGGDDGDFLMGEAGTDVLRGGFGNDTLWGGGNNDTLQGGEHRPARRRRGRRPARGRRRRRCPVCRRRQRHAAGRTGAGHSVRGGWGWRRDTDRRQRGGPVFLRGLLFEFQPDGDGRHYRLRRRRIARRRCAVSARHSRPASGVRRTAQLWRGRGRRSGQPGGRRLCRCFVQP